MTRIKTLEVTDQLFVVAMAVLLLLPHWPDSYAERIRRIGKDKLGETVKQFQIHHPKAICGKFTFVYTMEINAKNLVGAEDKDDLDTNCCLNDKDSLNEISPFPILNLHDCAFHAVFCKRGLYSLSYMLDVRSVNTVLSTFKEFYGPPDRMFSDPTDPSKLVFFDWFRGGTSLEVKLSQLGNDEESKNPSAEPWLETVSVSLWDGDLIIDRRGK
jgi:hypothetical protein